MELDQVDLSLYCLAMLQARITLPAKFFTKGREEEGRGGSEVFKDIWVEWQILEGQDSKVNRGF